MRRGLYLALASFALLAPAAAAETVGSDLEAIDPTKAIVCPAGEACVVTQALGGNGGPFSPPTGMLARWSVKLGAEAPDGIRIVILSAHGTGGAGQEWRTIDVGTLQRSPDPDGVATFSERLPIHADESFGVRLEASSRAGTRASIAAPFAGEYGTMLLWDPPIPFGEPGRLADRRFDRTRIAISADVVPPDPERCAPFNTYTGSAHGDDYGGFGEGGDVIYGLGGNDSLRGYELDDCIYGGRGNDRIAGMDDSDLLSGGPGSDDVGAGKGNDRILVRDGVRDTVRCGSGRDIVKADSLDRLSACEEVRRG